MNQKSGRHKVKSQGTLGVSRKKGEIHGRKSQASYKDK